jgi:two-component system, OmpR family, sensor histidine kinase QseC
LIRYRLARSIRARLLFAIFAALVVILGSTAWWSYEVTRHESEELFGARLATSARVLDALVARQVERATISHPLVVELPKELEHAGDDQGSALGHPYETKIAFQIWRDDGMLLLRSASAPVRPFSPNVAGFSLERIDGELYHVFVLQSGTTWIQVAEKDEVRGELIRELGAAVMTPLVTGAVLLLLLVHLLVFYGLRPLRQLTTQIERRQPDALAPFELAAAPLEVAPVVRALNDLLERVRQAFEHERRFTDAAAHELRTPIAALKIHAENVARARNEAERRHSLARLAQALERTSRLAAQMLAYSRAQNASAPPQREAVRLMDVVREATTAAEPATRSRDQHLRVVEPPPGEEARIDADSCEIQRLIVNLLDNASRYAPQHSTIEVAVRADESGVILSVSNEGPAIPAELRERVFDAYYRIPGSPSDGSGLGLAIVREIALRHGAAVRLTPLRGAHGTRVSVCFPPLSRESAGDAGAVRDADRAVPASGPAALLRRTRLRGCAGRPSLSVKAR